MMKFMLITVDVDVDVDISYRKNGVMEGGYALIAFYHNYHLVLSFQINLI